LKFSVFAFGAEVVGAVEQALDVVVVPLVIVVIVVGLFLLIRLRADEAGRVRGGGLAA
jgi:hypothetical protein